MNTTTTKQNSTTSAAGHTPGPWQMGEAIPADNTLPVISQWNAKGSRVIAYVTPKPCFDDTREANARLIAAAPELLAALKDAADMLRLMGIDMNGHEMTRNIQAAIARATTTQS